MSFQILKHISSTYTHTQTNLRKHLSLAYTFIKISLYKYRRTLNYQSRLTVNISVNVLILR